MKVIISLTTISSRIDSVNRVIQSLLKNELPNDLGLEVLIILYISRAPFLLDTGISKIPAALSSLCKRTALSSMNPKLLIKYVDNYGPHRKYFFSFLEQNDIIITVDDDTIYPKDFITTMVSAINQHDCVVAMRGREITLANLALDCYNKWNKENLSKHPSLKSVGTGKDGIAYKVNYLHKAVFDIETALTIAPKADDLWLKAHTLLEGVPTFIINKHLSDEFQEIGSSNNKKSLFSEFNKMGGNDSALAEIDRYLMSNFQTTFYRLVNA
jgi:hypothetical protein